MTQLLEVPTTQRTLEKNERGIRRSGSIAARLPTKKGMMYDSASTYPMHVCEFRKSDYATSEANGWHSPEDRKTAMLAVFDAGATAMQQRHAELVGRGLTHTEMMAKLTSEHMQRIPDAERDLTLKYTRAEREPNEPHQMFLNRFQNLGEALEKSEAEIAVQFDTALSAKDRRLLTRSGMMTGTALAKCAFLTGRCSKTSRCSRRMIKRRRCSCRPCRCKTPRPPPHK
jgi:hypothetical protein